MNYSWILKFLISGILQFMKYLHTILQKDYPRCNCYNVLCAYGYGLLTDENSSVQLNGWRYKAGKSGLWYKNWFSPTCVKLHEPYWVIVSIGSGASVDILVVGMVDVSVVVVGLVDASVVVGFVEIIVDVSTTLKYIKNICSNEFILKKNFYVKQF